ncbi:hypothetical protein [Natronococcus wangiae]|uniref:hypothetical protein n=1 Tax=Natronococcus wangiae TaxID=3068275 RepID=UPI00273CF812|nr:hypothetical protein [Natronococcus sp. AD5]
MEWDELDGSRRHLTSTRAALLAGLAFVGCVYLLESAGVDVTGRRFGRLDWVMLLGTTVLFAGGLVPAVRHRALLKRIMRRLLSRPSHAAAATFLIGLSLAAVLGSLILGSPDLAFQHAFTRRTDSRASTAGTRSVSAELRRVKGSPDTVTGR